MVQLGAWSFCFLVRKVGNVNFCLKAVVRSSVQLGLTHSNHLNVLQVSVITVGRSAEALSAITRLNDVAEMQ